MIRITALLAPALLAGCASIGDDYVQLVGTRYHPAAIDTYPVTVSKVDGRSTALQPPAITSPGRHVVAVQSAPDPVRRFGVERRIELDLRPCTRYHLVAVKASPLSGDFTVRIDHEEPIAGCGGAKG